MIESVAFEGLNETKQKQIDCLKKKLIDSKFSNQKVLETTIAELNDEEILTIREVAIDETFYDFTESGNNEYL